MALDPQSELWVMTRQECRSYIPFGNWGVESTPMHLPPTARSRHDVAAACPTTDASTPRDTHRVLEGSSVTDVVGPTVVHPFGREMSRKRVAITDGVSLVRNGFIQGWLFQ